MTRPAHMSPVDAVVAGALGPGTLLAGSFEILAVVGQGGMAVVYEAIQKSLNRKVAIKVLHHRFATDPEFVARFEAESGALASLSHPNIVNIIDRGHDHNLYFFVMEYVQGRTLDQLILDNVLQHGDWKRVIEACSNGMEYVHKRGIVHRDLKPSNILMGAEDTVKISDFGIAHILAGTELQVQLGTDQPRAVGTAHYMAPEQTSDPANVDHRADVYSLGVTFYKMMARAIPKAGMPLRNPSDLNSDVPAAADKVLLRALAPDRTHRYQTVREFCADLQKALKDRSTSIVSVLGAGKVQPGMSLYGSEDFRPGAKPIDHTPMPRKDRETTPRRIGKEQREESLSTARILERLTPLPVRNTTPAPVQSRNTPLPVSQRTPPTPVSRTPTQEALAATPKPVALPPVNDTDETAARTPKPVSRTPTPAAGVRKPAAAAAPHPQRGLKVVAGLAAVLGVGLLAGVAVLALRPAPEPAPAQTPTHDMSTTVTEQRQRALEQVLRERGELADEEDNAQGVTE